MLIEIVYVLLIFLIGYFTIKLLRVSGYLCHGNDLIIGLCLFILAGSIQTAIFRQVFPMATLLSLLGLISLACGYRQSHRSNHSNHRFPSKKFSPSLVFRRMIQAGLRHRFLILCLLSITVAVAVLYPLNLVNYHVDSLEYLSIGSVLSHNTFEPGISSGQLVKRLLAVPLMHSPAHLSGNLYLRSLTPLLAISTLLSLAWFINSGLKTHRIPADQRVYGILLGLLLLASNNRFVHNAFYINGHLLTSVLILATAGASWLIARRSEIPVNFLVFFQCIAIPVAVVTRAENFILFGIILIPTLISSKISRIHRALILASLGLSTSIWALFYASVISSRSFLSIAWLSLLITCLLPWIYYKILAPWIEGLQNRQSLLKAVEILIWIIPGFGWLFRTGILRNSLTAIFQNIVEGRGLWGYSLIALFFLVVAILIFSPVPSSPHLRFPVTTFIPLSLIFAYLRGSPYRSGPYDSLNRMFIHIVPLAILFIIIMAFVCRESVQDYRRKKMEPNEL